MYSQKIFPLLFLLAIFLFVPVLFAQKVNSQTVRRLIYEVKPNEWYLTQAEFWQKETQKNPKNPIAWRNYYLAVRYATHSIYPASL